jgi:hypothetical protein
VSHCDVAHGTCAQAERRARAQHIDGGVEDAEQPHSRWTNPHGNKFVEHHRTDVADHLHAPKHLYGAENGAGYVYAVVAHFMSTL